MAMTKHSKFHNQLVFKLENILKTYYPVGCMYELTVIVEPA